jgi:hypothetical protein
MAIVAELIDAASMPAVPLADALTRLCGVIHMHGHEEADVAAIAGVGNVVVVTLARLLHHAVVERKEWGSVGVGRVMHAALHALTQLLAHMPPVARALDAGTIGDLIHILLSCLLHPRLTAAGGDEERVGRAGGGRGLEGSWVEPRADRSGQGSSRQMRGAVTLWGGGGEATRQMARSMNALLASVLKQAHPNRVLSVLIAYMYARAPPPDSNAAALLSRQKTKKQNKKARSIYVSPSCRLSLDMCVLILLYISLILISRHVCPHTAVYIPHPYL